MSEFEENFDINNEIQRILSSNISSQLYNCLSIQCLSSPMIKNSRNNMFKSSKFIDRSISSIKSGEKSDQNNSICDIDQNIINSKAQQVLKLHEMLLSQMQNMNEIIKKNELLMKQKQIYTIELKCLKQQYNDLKDITSKQLKRLNENMQQMINEILNKISYPHIKQNTNFQISKCYEHNIHIQSKQSKQSFIAKINSLELELQSTKLFNQNYLSINKQLNQQLQTLKLSILNPQQLNNNKNPSVQIQCYTSIFLQSINENQCQLSDTLFNTIRQIMFSNQITNSLLPQLISINYYGKIQSEKKTGLAVEEYSNNWKYQGWLKNNCRHSYGILYYHNIKVYEGQWHQGFMEGKGTLYFYKDQNVQKVQGNFKSNYLQGYATLYYKSSGQLVVKFKKNKLLSASMLLNKQNMIKQSCLTSKLRPQLGKINVIKQQNSSLLRFVNSKNNCQIQLK